MKVQFGNEIVDSQELSTTERQLWLEEFYHTAKRHHIHCTCNSKATMHLKYWKKSKRYSLSCNPNHRHLHEKWCEFSLELSEQQLQGTHYSPIEQVNESELNINMKHLRIFIPDAPASKENIEEIDLKRARETGTKVTLSSLGREFLSRAWESVMLKYHHAITIKDNNKFYPSKRVIHIELNKLFLQNEGIKVNLGQKKKLSDVLWIGQKKTESFYYYNQEKIRPIILCPLIKNNVQIGQETVLFEVEGLSKDSKYSLSTTIEYWNSAVNNCPVDFLTHDYFYVIGLGLNKGAGNPPLIQRLEFIPITTKGLIIDSVEQYKLFQLLESNLRLFIRPNNVLEHLEGLSPTALLIDSSIPCLIEIFDQPESNKAYHKLKNRKMLYYKELGNYQTYYWHSYRTSKIPPFPKRQTQLE